MYPQNRGTVRTRHKSLAVIYMEIRTKPGLCLVQGKWNLGIHLRFHFFLAFGRLRPHQTDSRLLLQRSGDNDEEQKQGTRVGKKIVTLKGDVTLANSLPPPPLFF